MYLILYLYQSFGIHTVLLFFRVVAENTSLNWNVLIGHTDLERIPWVRTPNFKMYCTCTLSMPKLVSIFYKPPYLLNLKALTIWR